ncbi:transcriptional regulator, TraR/DksA family [Meinhardsimonia xiamenensis]|jgi:RNA polymerase-binding transcription factor DksA|uniref:Transcriptional regulator, TraR/DksA family n=1 Tax=Meinhardsimonia xiamenensis TaxID=990712 RepID=A0A1G9BH65_9RHOB|nr:TraR/DksA family transcriptional regulator [Meinhardsimonia xiamenensis]PRX34990.1 TraR/DksA family transcriptional regulator [Meinhardsimonia xiamenensis]SDK38560.1 transcriptional regulator, TraR/DksA family [Meinhardsimonia xiamenensis]
MTDLAQRRATLEARLKELEERIREAEQELEGHDTKDWEDLAQERENDEVLEDMIVNAREEIRAIQAALKRMDEGEYGYCVRCGAEIAEERLDLVPYTPFCATCAAEVSSHH